MDSVIGKIQCLRVENFVTYDEITVEPGLYLNLILGPNGTGKSTLVAAIVLGMGGEPKLLSRATDIRDYVKNGKQNAFVEVSIYTSDNRKETCVFRRSFDLSGKSTYKVNNRPVTHAQYLKNIAQYNIQIDNLCQFLPQDRVQDFAKMNPQELLNSTQESICTPEMIDRFKKLKELRCTQKNGDKTLGENQKHLKELEERNAQLQAVIEKIRLRQKFLNDIQVAEKKRAWLELDEIEKDLKLSSDMIAKARDEFNHDERIFTDIQARSRNLITKRDNMIAEVQQEDVKISDLCKQLNAIEDNLTELENKILAAERDLQDKKIDMNELDKEIQQAVRLLEGFLEDLSIARQSCGDEYQKEIAALKSSKASKSKEILDLTNQRSDINHEIERWQPELVSIRNQINNIQNERERRVQKLRQIDDHVYKAVEWLNRNRHIFEGHVYDPIILELRVKEAKNAMYLENTIAKRDMLAFVCTEKSDVQLLVQKLCVEQKLRINVLHSEQADRCEYSSDVPISQLRKYGFYSYLLDMVEAPAPILNLLCKFNKIHKILVGTDEVEKQVENLPRQITLFFSSQNRFTKNVSRYTGETSSSCFKISPKNMFSTSIDERQLNEYKRRLFEITRNTDDMKNKRSALESKINECNETVSEISRTISLKEAKLVELQDKKRQVKFQEMRITKLKANVVDIADEEKKFETFCHQTFSEMLQIQRNKITVFRQYQEARQKHQYSAVKLNIFRNETSDIENELKTAEDNFKAAKKKLDKFQNNHENIKSKYEKKEQEAVKLCNDEHRNNRKFPYHKAFNSLPNTLQELEERLIELQTRAECMTKFKVDVVDYEAREREIQELRKTINQKQSEQSDLGSKIREIHDHWYPYFMEKVNIINQKFSRFMSLLEYAGEVNITHNDPNDYDTYGIQILVQYRNNAKLQALDRFTQSGGERAVAIAIYSMSLQSLTHVPFRCVDEINQGMDPKNERKVFNLIVDETCQIGGSQYFFVTPKLLPGLKSHELMTALIIFNGDISSPDIFNRAMKRLLQKK